MEKRTRHWMAVAAAALVVGIAAGATALDDQQKARIIDYFRMKQDLPPNVNVEIKQIEDSPIQGAKVATLRMWLGNREQEMSVLISDDGRYVAFAELEDVTKNPFEEVAKKITTKGQPTKGPADAPVTLVEFSDFQCPYCARAHKTLKEQVLPAYEGKVRLVYKNFPLGFHKWAKPAAIAGECAHDQNPDAFWTLYDYFFDHQREINKNNVREKAKEALKDSKIDLAKWEACLDDPAVAQRVDADMAEGQEVGVSGTPAFFINGRKVSGAQPAEKFKAIIDDELARAAKKS